MRWPRARPSGSRRPHVRRLLRGNDPDSCRAHLAEGGPGSGAVETLRRWEPRVGAERPARAGRKLFLSVFVHLMWKRGREVNPRQAGDRGGARTRGAAPARLRPSRGGRRSLLQPVACPRSSPAPAPPAAWLREAFPLAAPPTPGCSGTHCRSSETKSSSSVNAAGAACATVAVRTVGKATGRHHG